MHGDSHKGNKTYFISDLHLGARYVGDRFAHERMVVQMLESFGRDAAHIYMLGDVLDYWFEYRTVVPRGYVRFFGELARLVDNGVRLTWIIGNHDIWLFDYLRDEIGVEIVDGALIRKIDGKNFYMAHGDGLGKLNKKSFRFVRALFRNKLCQKLYAGIHPRWTVPFAYRWSSGSRNRSSDAEYKSWMGDEKETQLVFAKKYLENVDSEINYFIFGHRHLTVDRQLSPDCRFVILGDCITRMNYAVWDGSELQIKSM